MKKSSTPLSLCVATVIAAIVSLTGCTSLNKALLSPPIPVVETTPAGQTVTNYVQLPSPAVTNAVVVGQAVAQLLPPGQSQGLTAILGLGAGLLAAYGRYQGTKRVQETKALENDLIVANGQRNDAETKAYNNSAMLDTVIRGVESANQPVVKEHIEAAAKKAGYPVTTELYQRVQEITSGRV